MSSLENCYKKLVDIYGKDIEPYEIIESVESHRQYWKPHKTNVLLIAESHVHTQVNEFSECTYPTCITDLPKHFVRFVYCLGYGEKEIAPNEVIKNHGTPQYWQLFFSCLHRINDNDDFLPISKKTEFEKRINNKLDLLNQMRDVGIWLLDSSVVALFRPGKSALSPKKMKQIIESSWKDYVSLQAKSVNPKEIIVIGKGVWNNIQDNFNLDVRVTVFPQPNAWLSNKERLKMFRDYYDICSKYKYNKLISFPIKKIDKESNTPEFYAEGIKEILTRNRIIRFMSMLKEEINLDRDLIKDPHRILKKADKGDSNALCAAGFSLLTLNQEKLSNAKYDEAVSYFMRATKLGCRYAPYLLGVMYRDGIGLNKDIAKGLQYLEESAKQHFSYAQNAVGVLSYKTQDNINLEFISECFKNAATIGLPEAQYNLAIMHEKGLVSEASLLYAKELHRHAARLNFIPAQYRLGKSYLNSENAWFDKVKAYSWFSIAAKTGHSKAAEQVKKLGQEMLTHERFEARKNIKDLKLCFRAIGPLFHSQNF
jgi:TPR repeat protein